MTSPVRRQNLLIDIGGIVVLALLGAVFYCQAVQPWMEQDQANQTLQRRFLSLRQKAASVSSLERRLRQELVGQQRSMPTSAAAREDVRRLNARLSRIAALASKQGLQLRNLEPGKPSAEGDRVLLPIRLTGVADYRGCAEFLHAMRTDFGDTSVYSMRMSARPNGEKTAVDFEMNLRWYAASSLVSVQN